MNGLSEATATKKTKDKAMSEQARTILSRTQAVAVEAQDANRVASRVVANQERAK